MENNDMNKKEENNQIEAKSENKKTIKPKHIVIALLYLSVFVILTFAIIREEKMIEKEQQKNNKYNNSTNWNYNDDDEKEENQDEEPNEEKKTDSEYVITNKKTQDDFKKRDENKEKEMAIKIADKIGESYSIIGSFTDFYFNSSYNLAEINDSVKVRLVANYMIYNDDYSTRVSNGSGHGSDYMISLSKQKELCNKFFGKQIEINENLYKNIEYPIANKEKSDMLGTRLTCPNFDKIEGDNIYFNNRCGGTSPRRVYIYEYDLKEHNDVIEIFTAAAYPFEKYIEEEKEYITIIYKDFDYNKDSIYDTFFPSKDGDFVLNEYNKDKFNNFKLTFKKNDKGNYIFEKSELIKK